MARPPAGKGERPEAKGDEPFFLAPECGYAVLFDEDATAGLRGGAWPSTTSISEVFLVTDSEEAYAEMRERVGQGRKTRMLYRDYLRHFRRRPRL